MLNQKINSVDAFTKWFEFRSNTFQPAHSFSSKWVVITHAGYQFFTIGTICILQRLQYLDSIVFLISFVGCANKLLVFYLLSLEGVCDTITTKQATVLCARVKFNC